MAQMKNTRFTTDGDWSTPANWDNGVPTASDNVFIQGVDCTISSNAECDNIRLETGSSLTINAGDTLNIIGGIDIEDFVTITNSGVLLIRGDMRRNNTTKATLGGTVIFRSSFELNDELGVN